MEDACECGNEASGSVKWVWRGGVLGLGGETSGKEISGET